MVWVVDLDQRTAAYKLHRKSSSGRCYLRFFFDLMDIAIVNSHFVYKTLYPKGMELVDFKIVIAKSLIGPYNSRCRNTSITHTPRPSPRSPSRICFTAFTSNSDNKR